MGNTNLQQQKKEEEKMSIEIDEFFNPLHGQPFEISQENYLAKQSLRRMMRLQNESGEKQTRKSRQIIETSLTRKTNTLITKESKQLRERDRKGIVFVNDG